MSTCVHLGIQMGGLFKNGSKQWCVDDMLIPWVSEVITIVIILNLATFACF